LIEACFAEGDEQIDPLAKGALTRVW
jgi:hypothetical protein